MTAGFPDKLKLNYAAPEIIWQRSFRWRSCTLGMVLFLAPGSLLLGTLPLAIEDSTLGIVTGSCGCLAFVIGVYCLVRWIRNDETNLVISHDGIRYGRRNWMWREIEELGGYKCSDGVQLFLLYRPSEGRSRRIGRTLGVTPALRLEEFESLMEELSLFLKANFPRVYVIQAPQEPPSFGGS